MHDAQVRTPPNPNYDLIPDVNQQAITVSAPDRRVAMAHTKSPVGMGNSTAGCAVLKRT